MEFTLVYRGPLGSNARSNAKHEIRRQFHKQLRVLIEESVQPFSSLYRESSKLESDSNTNIFMRGSFRFIPLVSQRLKSVVELQIQILRPERSGVIITQGGDIDNRIKTLLDALKVPDENAVIGNPLDGEDPFYCLMEDDRLVVRLDVRAEWWLEPDVQNSDVLVLTHVRMDIQGGLTWENTGLLGRTP